MSVTMSFELQDVKNRQEAEEASLQVISEVIGAYEKINLYNITMDFSPNPRDTKFLRERWQDTPHKSWSVTVQYFWNPAPTSALRDPE